VQRAAALNGPAARQLSRLRHYPEHSADRGRCTLRPLHRQGSEPGDRAL